MLNLSVSQKVYNVEPYCFSKSLYFQLKILANSLKNYVGTRDFPPGQVHQKPISLIHCCVLQLYHSIWGCSNYCAAAAQGNLIPLVLDSH
ncbi:hypothetical protein Peur_055965 [Populus x canadensis]